jgi:uncharacterized protein (TIGR02118 family)
VIRISAVYPNSPGSHFNGAYYQGSHTALAMKLLGPHGLQSVRVTLGVAGLDGAPPAYWAIGEMVFSSREAFEKAVAESGAALFADTPNYTNASPVMQVSTLQGD